VATGDTYPRGLDEVLQSTSDVLFPEEMGKRKVDPTSRDAEGDTPLHVILWRNDERGAELLIEAGADVNAIGDMGETPLHVAVRQKNGRLVSALLNAGAKSDIRSEFGQTPMEMAADAGDAIASLFEPPNNALERARDK
jgi:ankyrin repeat protein